MDDERTEQEDQRAPARLGAAPTRAHAHHAARRGSRRTAGVLHRRVHRRLAADPHVRPAGVRGLDPAHRHSRKGSQPVRPERVLRLPFRLLAPAGRARGALLPLPQGLAAGRLLRERPVAEPARHRAHRAGSLAGVGLAPRRLAARALLRPALRRSALADAADEIALLRYAGRSADLLRRDEERKVGLCCATPASCTPSMSSRRTRASPRPPPASRAPTRRSSRGTTRSSTRRRTSSKRRPTSRRSTGATGSPGTRCR